MPTEPSFRVTTTPKDLVAEVPLSVGETYSCQNVGPASIRVTSENPSLVDVDDALGKGHRILPNEWYLIDEIESGDAIYVYAENDSAGLIIT